MLIVQETIIRENDYRVACRWGHRLKSFSLYDMAKFSYPNHIERREKGHAWGILAIMASCMAAFVPMATSFWNVFIFKESKLNQVDTKLYVTQTYFLSIL